MTTPLRDALTQRINQVGPAHPDLEELVGLGEQRLRRRRLTAVLGAAATVVLAVAVGVAALNGSGTPRPAPPIDRPSPREEKPPARQIVYSDETVGVPGHTVHFGDRLVETGNNHVHLDVTDDGFLYTYRGGVWFSDGGTPVRVGTPGCPGASTNGEFGNFDTGAVMTANSGSTAAWLDCTRPAGPTLVVFDTSSRRVVARQPVPSCCGLVDVTSDYVYVGSSRFDLRTHRLRASTPRERAEDLRSQSRGLVLGDDWQSGTPTTGDGGPLAADHAHLTFVAVGARLVPTVWVDTDHHRVTSAFDTATRRTVRLRLPAGYPHRGDSFDLVEWLDDDTAAFFGGGADILTCRLSTGRCLVAVPGPDSDTWRIVPARPLPG